MKKNLLFPLLFLFVLKTNAQITLDNVVTPGLGIGYDFYTVQISASETKYLFADTTTNTFSLLNMDFTPFMTNISVPEPFAWSSSQFQVLYVTRSLFDCDSSNIEYVYQASTAATYKPFRVMRTDGTQLFQLDSAYGPYCLGGCLGMSDIIIPIRNTSDGAKLFLYKTATGQINIYSLCGTLPDEVFDFTNSNQSFVKIFPNPASSTLTFQINPPDNINEYELIILDNSAKEIKRKKIDSRKDKQVIDVSSFSSGTYFYSLRTKNKAYQSGKFILAK